MSITLGGASAVLCSAMQNCVNTDAAVFTWILSHLLCSHPLHHYHCTRIQSPLRGIKTKWKSKKQREREEGRKIKRKALGINIIWLNTVYAYCSTSKSSALFLNWYCMSSNNTPEGCWLDASIFSCSSFFITKKKHNSSPAALFDYWVTLSYAQLCTSSLFVDQGKDELWLEGSLGDLTAQRQADKLY